MIPMKSHRLGFLFVASHVAPLASHTQELKNHASGPRSKAGQRDGMPRFHSIRQKLIRHDVHAPTRIR
jgi:hypothetical protein